MVALERKTQKDPSTKELIKSEQQDNTNVPIFHNTSLRNSLALVPTTNDTKIKEETKEPKNEELQKKLSRAQKWIQIMNELITNNKSNSQIVNLNKAISSFSGRNCYFCFEPMRDSLNPGIK